MARPNYFDFSAISKMNQARKEIFSIRADIYNQYKIDILDTDALSALSIYEVVSQYDPEYNINFSRNGEDAKSGDVHIEMKATRVKTPFTEHGKLRKSADRDANFSFHAMGDLEHSRYIFVARYETDLSLSRLYDISEENNRKLIVEHLKNQSQAWLARCNNDLSKMKRDVIYLPETFILKHIKFPTKKSINNCTVYKD